MSVSTELLPSRRPLVADLYAGAGGLSLGMEQAGFDVAVAAEFDAVHALVHRFNFPHAPVLHRDLSLGSVPEVGNLIMAKAEAQWKRLSQGQPFPGLDAIVGGPPCQGFSVGGVRNADDDRNGQLIRFVDLVVELRPKVFCLENVAGLLEPRFAPLRFEATSRLRAAGYDVRGFDSLFNAASFGVPQNRRRVIVTGSRIGPAPEVRTDAAGEVTVADALAGLPDLAHYARLLSSDSVLMREGDIEGMLGVESRYARLMTGADRDSRDLSYSRPHDPSYLTNSRRTVHRPKTVQRFSRTKPGGVERVSHLFRLDPAKLARTLRAGTGAERGSHTSPRPIHPQKNRVITVREAARLHGYPDWFRFHTTNWHGHRQVGNSVPPPLAAAVGRALIAAIATDVDLTVGSAMGLGDPAWLSHNMGEATRTLRELDSELSEDTAAVR